MGPRIHLCLSTTLLLGALAVETLTAQTTSPVAYVYVARPTHLDGFAASSTGRLHPVPGSPFSGIAVSHLSVTNKFLFGAGDDNQSLFSYALASNGSVRKVGQINAHAYPPDGNDCYSVGPTQVDFARKTLYNNDWNCDGDSQYIQSYRIESSGQLTFLKNTETVSNQFTMSNPVVLGNDQYLYVTANYSLVGNPGGQIEALKRNSDGTLDVANGYIPMPPYPSSYKVFAPYNVLATDPTNHVAMEMVPQDAVTGSDDGPVVIASFTAHSDGNLTTTNTLAQMVRPTVIAHVMSISPTGKLLAVGGGPSGTSLGFQIMHFNGGSPITKYSGVLQNKYLFRQFGWDKHNHLYALSSNYLFVYTVTPTSIQQAPGSPYSIPEAASLIVLCLP